MPASDVTHSKGVNRLQHDAGLVKKANAYRSLRPSSGSIFEPDFSLPAARCHGELPHLLDKPFVCAPVIGRADNRVSDLCARTKLRVPPGRKETLANSGLILHLQVSFIIPYYPSACLPLFQKEFGLSFHLGFKKVGANFTKPVYRHDPESYSNAIDYLYNNWNRPFLFL